MLLALLADLWEYGSRKVATFLAPHIQSSLLCAVYLLFSHQKEKLFDEKTKGVLSLIYFFWISMFLKTGVYWYSCSTYSTDCVEKEDCLYSNVLDLINDNLSSVWSLWGSVTLSVSFSIDQAHHSWWIECSLLLGKKSINFTQFLIKNCSSLRSFSWIFIFLITF